MNDKSIKCPKCGSEHINHLTIHTFVPLSEQFLYQCAKCQEVFGAADESGIEKAFE